MPEPRPEPNNDHTLAALIRRQVDAIKDPCSVASAVPLGLDEMGTSIRWTSRLTGM